MALNLSLEALVGLALMAGLAAPVLAATPPADAYLIEPGRRHEDVSEKVF